MIGNQKQHGALASSDKITVKKISIAFCILTMILSYVSGAVAHSYFTSAWVEGLLVLLIGVINFCFASMLVGTLLSGKSGGTHALVLIISFWFTLTTVRFSEEVGFGEGFCLRFLISSLITYIYALVVRRTMKVA